MTVGSSASQSVTITNTTTFTSTVNVSNIAISGTNAADYTETSTCTSLTEGQTCTVTVTFTPSATGTRSATLTITDDSTSDPTLTVSLTGNGLATTATLTPAAATFPGIYAGDGTSAAQVFTVTNTSTVAISVTGVALSSSNFTQTGTTCGGTLAAGATCTISVEFTPTASGALTGTLTVTNTSSADPTLTATLNGTGLATTAILTPISASFPNTVVGASSAAAKTFTWTNTSSVPLTVKSVGVSTGFAVNSSTCTGTVAANSSCVINVSFTPTTLGTTNGTLTVTSTSSANGTLSATLTGFGVADVETSASALSFGNVQVGSSSSAQTVTLTNYTNATIALTSMSISGDYSEATTCGSTLAGLSSCIISVVFTPTATGTRTGNLVINTNDIRYPVLTVSLTGNGVDFSIAVSPTSGNLIAGFYENVNLTVTPLGGFSSALTLSCTTNATGSVCTPSQNTVTPSAATAISVKITTTSQTTVIGYAGFGTRGWMVLVSFSLGTILYAGKRRARIPAVLAFLLTASVLSLTGCGSTPALNSNYTQPGTYTYTLTATNGAAVRSATYSLTVSSH